jgi:hypothetical protein
LLPQLRHGVGHRRLWRIPRQDSDGLGNQSRPDLPHAQTPVQRYLPKLLQLIDEGKIDPTEVITHVAPLEQGPELYETFRDKKDGCIKVVLKPGMTERPLEGRKESVHA